MVTRPAAGGDRGEVAGSVPGTLEEAAKVR